MIQLTHRSLSTLAVAALLAAPASAQLDYYSILDGAQHGNNSQHTGVAAVTIDTATNHFDYTITYTGTDSLEMGAFIHGPADPGQFAGAVHQLPSGNPKIGTWFYDESMEAGILGGRYYMDIHTQDLPSGELRGQICPTPEFYCACDAASGPPCGNADPDGGCANSTGQGAQLTITGLPSVILDTLEIRATRVPANQLGIFFMADNQTQNPFGDGQLCATGGIQRFLPPQSSGMGGTLTLPPGLAEAANLSAGQIKTFQAWFRDPMGPCGSGFNTSDAVQVRWTP